MARVEYGSEITALRGSIGGITFHRNPSGNIARLRPLQLSRNTPKQMSSQILFSVFRSSWAALSTALQALWNQFAALHTRTNYFGEEKTLTGYNWYMSINVSGNLCGMPELTSPPAYVVPPLPQTFFLIISPTNIFIVFTAAYDHTTVFLFLYLSPPVRSQSLLDRSKIRLVTVLDASVYVYYNITSAYNSYFNLASLPLSPDGSARLLCSLAAIHYLSFISSSFTSFLAPFPETLPLAIGSGFNALVFSSVLQPDGKIVFAGVFTAYKGVTCNRIVRLLNDGSIDPDFDTGSGFNEIVRSVCIDSSGRFIACGDFSYYNSNFALRICRLTSTGAYDATFSSSPGANDTISTVQIAPDGNILVGGNFTSIAGVARNRIAALTPSGAIFSNFDPGTGFNAAVLSITIFDQDYFFVVGSFTAFDGDPALRAAKLAYDGTLDTTFDTSTGFNYNVLTCAFDSAGNLFFGGDFTAYKGAAALYIAKLTPLGALDTSFPVSTAFNAYVRSITIDANGFIFCVGAFTFFKGYTAPCSVRLRTNAVIDYSYSVASFTGSSVFSIFFDTQQRVVLSGNFSNINGVAQNHIARLYLDGTLNSS